MCVVIDLNAVCLICLQPGKDLHPIFTADSDDPELEIAQKISILSELKINRNNKTLPKKICSKCFQDLKTAWRFRKNCKAAVTIFQTIVQLENVHSENTTTKELEEETISVPSGLQVLLESIKTDKNEEVKQANSKQAAEYTSSDTEGLYQRKNQDTNEFQTFDETSENEQEQNDDFENENNLVEYYLSDDVISESNDEKEETVKIIEKKQTNAATYADKAYKPSTRGRPRKQTLLQRGITKRSNVQTKIKSTIVLDGANSSEDTAQTEIRQVKTRKRKSISPERKTPKICEICGNSYRFQHALNAHMRRHYNDKPFPCECCDKAFVSNVELRRHMRVHTGQKPYACQYCERRFSDFGSRIKHERTHTGERPYLCVTCGKSFAYPHVLSVHLRTHTGEKKFRCNYCTKGFTKKTYLISHVNQHHSSFQIVIGDTIVESQLKSKSLDEGIYTAEFTNEEQIAEAQEYDEDSNEGCRKAEKSLIKPKVEVDEEAEINEIVVEQEDYDISVR